MLENGRGSGDLFLSSLLNTGNYHLVGYTQWMRNFGDYARQELLIFNPFEYYKPPAGGNGSPTVTIHPEDGFLNVDQMNTLIVKGVYGNQTPFSSKARIVNGEGDNLINFELNEFGFAKIEFKPEANKSYRIIAESDTGEFLFFDLPQLCSDCPLLTVDSRKNDFLVQLKKGPVPSWLEVVDSQNRYFSRSIQDNESFTVLRSILPQGFVQIKLWSADKSKLISTRNLLNEGSGVIQVEGKRTYGVRTKLEERFELPETGASVSVSVSKKYANNLNPFKLAFDQEINEYINYPRKAVGEANLLDYVLAVDKPDVKPLSASFEPKYLPEYRTDQVTGKLSSDGSIKNPIVAGAVMNGQLKLAKPDSEGRVLLNLHPEKEGTEVLAKLTGNSQEATLEWESEFYESYPEMVNTPFALDSVRVAALADRSVKNQIQNVYYAFNPDSSIAIERPYETQFIPVKTYKLADFTRFPTMRDTFIEYIEEVAVNKDENNFDLRMRLWDSAQDHPSDTTELVLIDGVPFSSQEALEMSPYGVEAIHVIPNHYYMGEVTLKGILYLETLERDLSGLNYQQYNINYVGVQSRKTYKKTDHTDICEEPDYRDQLLWIPEMNLESNHLEFDFFTSDIPGTYQINIEGVTASGNPISIQKSFIVE